MSEGNSPKYKRILLKISGEVLAGEQKSGIDFTKVMEICRSVKKCSDAGVESGIVVGGGNFWRGRSSGEMDRTRADHMGMLATVINCLALADGIEQTGAQARVQTAISMQQIAEPYIRGRAVRHLEKGRVVIFACGTGNPFFSTDTAAALRAVEIGADAILLAKNVDGVYDSDPRVNPEAKLLRDITYQEVQERDLKVMDASAITICRENKVPCIRVFGLDDPQNILRVIEGDMMGTVVHP